MPLYNTPADIAQLKFIKENLSGIIIQAIAGSIYTEDWIAAIAKRETGQLMLKKFNQGIKPPELWKAMLGDFSQRRGETKPRYHGFGVFQIDIASYPAFCAGTDWQDPLKCCLMAIRVLNSKQQFLSSHTALTGESLFKGITAAYNTGEGNVRNSVNKGIPVDTTTAGGDYSTAVWAFREIYTQLP